jgi:UDP-2,3-diacylglucosamine hydrolase
VPIQLQQAEAQSKLIALFVSDIHLQPSLPKTTAAFLDFLATYASKADRIYILGDMFEYWAGDDDIETSCHGTLITTLRALTDSGIEIYWIPGNRDFLVGDVFANKTGIQFLTDPSVIEVSKLKILVAHGDAQCTDDISYMAFRNTVRQEQWKKDFLTLPLTQRKSIIEGLRVNSKMEQKGKTAEIMDVNPEAIKKLFQNYGVNIIIHGHTHRTAKHQHLEGVRYVLPDWDCDAEESEARGGWLEIDSDGEISFRHLNHRTPS